MNLLAKEGHFLLREYLFANLARSFIDLFMPKNLPLTFQNKIAHLALAVELYHRWDRFFSEPSYNEYTQQL